jgi:AAA domain
MSEALDKVLAEVTSGVSAEHGLHEPIHPEMLGSWTRVDLTTLDTIDETPTLCARSDGQCLMYEHALHAFFGPPGSAKTWLMLHIAGQIIEAGGNALYLDFEGTPRRMAARLDALGIDRGRFHYVRPVDPLPSGHAGPYDTLLAELAPRVTFIDGVTEAMTLFDLDMRDNADVARFYRRLARPAQEVGAVGLADHVVKNAENRGHMAIGAQHKRAGLDVDYELTVTRPWARATDGEREGRVALACGKDRHGTYAAGERVADLAFTAYPDGGVTIRLDAPEVRDENWRPTVLMERVSLELEGHPDGLAGQGIEDRVRGKAAEVRRATAFLVDDGHAEVSGGARGAHIHRSIRPYRKPTP